MKEERGEWEEERKDKRIKQRRKDTVIHSA